jgi:hypothetical protein
MVWQFYKLSAELPAICFCSAAAAQAVMVEKHKPAMAPGGMGPAGMPSGMTM